MAAETVRFNLEAVDRFSKPFSRAGKAVRSTGRTIRNLSLAAAGAATAVGAFVNKMAQGEDRAAKFAGRLGVAVDSLTRYQHAADLAGVRQRTFNLAIQRMSRRVGEAAQGTGEAQQAIAQLGLDAQRFSQLGLDRQLEVLSDRFETMEDRSDKLRLAFKLFDSEGVAMLQLLNQGSEEMRAMARDADFLGATIGQQAAANAEVFTNQTTRLTTAIGGASRAIADRWIPLLSGLAREAADSIAGMRGDLSDWAERSQRSMVALFVVGRDVFKRLHGLFTERFESDSWEGFATGGRRTLTNLGKFVVREFTEWSLSLGNQMIAIGAAAAEAAKHVLTDGLAGAGEVLVSGFQERMAELETAQGATLDRLLGRQVETTRAVAEGLRETFGITAEGVRSEVDRIIEAYSMIGEVSDRTQQETVTRTRSFMEELAEINSEFMGQQRSLTRQFAQGFHDTVLSAVDAISRGIAEVAVRGGNMLDRMKEIGKQVLQQLLAMLIKIGLQRLVLQGIQVAAEASTAKAQLSRSLANVYTNTFASIAAIPIVGPALAPGAAAGAVAAASAGAAGAAATGSALGGSVVGQAHGGLEDVPREGTFLLDRGERVLSRRQNEDLTRFLQDGSNGGAGRSVRVETLNVSVLPNATSGEALLNLSESEMREVVAGPIIRALDQLDDSGIRPKAIERRRS